jgi:hypothetical protein
MTSLTFSLLSATIDFFIKEKEANGFHLTDDFREKLYGRKIK